MENQNAQSQTHKGFRRKFPRRRYHAGIGVLSGGKYFMTTGFEIGEGGISFRSPKLLKVGALVIVNFQVPSGEFVSVRAEIRNTDNKPVPNKEAGDLVYGCAFENLRFERKREIRNFVTNRPESEV